MIQSAVEFGFPMSWFQERLGAQLAADRELVFQLCRRFWYSIRQFWWHSYWQLRVRGADHIPAGPALLCANHTSHLDAPAILAALPVRMALRTSTAAARDVFGDYPIRNQVSRLLTNALPVERGARFVAELRVLESVLRERRPLILFPEGRRSPNGELVGFKCGAAMLAIRTGAPIIPIHLEGVRQSLARGKHFPLPGRVCVHFGAPIDPSPYRAAIREDRIGKHEAYQQLTDVLKTAILQLAPTHGAEPL